MRISKYVLVIVFVFTGFAFAQEPAPAKSPEPGNRAVMGKRVIIRGGEMGEWWKDSEIAKKLQLGDNQITQLDQIFYDHKLKLIDYVAEMQKEDLKLQNLLDADVPNEGQIQSQVDQVLGARGKLERESTMMNLDLRKVLTVDQWHQLKAIQEKRGDHIFFYTQQKIGPGVGIGMGPGPVTMPAPPLPPGGPAPDNLF